MKIPTKILFSHAYFYQLDPKQWEAQEPYPPYNTILAAAIMQEKGFEVDLFDSNLKKSASEIEQKIIDFQPQYLVLYDDSFNYLSKMCLTNMREACLEMIRLAKKHDCLVLINSSDATDNYEKYLDAGADFVMLGEAEITLTELIEKLEQKKLGQDIVLDQVEGIVLKKENKLQKTKKRNSLTDLEHLPQPLWNLVKIADYQQIWQQKHGFFSLNIATTRGCPFKCNWCAKPIYGNRYNSRSPQKVANEIAFLMQNFNATHFWICDDIFGLKPNWVKEFKDFLAEKNVKPKLKIQSRADLLLKDDTIDDLVACGLDEVWIGAESGSQKILDAMDKGITVQEIERSSQLLKRKGVKVAFFLQYGYLDETKEDINLTLKMLEKLRPYTIGISVSYPLPGTIFHEKVKNQLKNKKNWKDSDDLDTMYQASFSSDFYKQLQRFTHAKFRKNRVLDDLFNQKKQLISLLKFPIFWINEKLSWTKLKWIEMKS
ncbi:B12-binding domain-containing radical SAM protein [Emticicia sp. SJ17W-69]|uniref:B12-binding domain-containing radical SAM protein n=1 Tax=Emticicia sp. SJ17W-69 TaxID=3421657 RepID=UPI003EBA9193